MTNLHQGYEVFTERSQDLVATGGLADKAAKGYLNKLLPWIEEHKDVPFFAFLHVEDPHSPYFAPPPYATIWGGPGDAATYTEWQNKSREHIDSPIMKQFGMPWTEDLTFQVNKFCNVFRDDDRQTRDFFSSVREQQLTAEDVVAHSIVFRMFNLVPTYLAIKHHITWDGFDAGAMK